ncbi:hypothetical protein F5B22DRAFT_646922 [Xylaria bambusicola]|uniref:uncharacterized protein n=1 Tax=Xylaria bambusicola TaxID=326684 RepID=UPI0020073294|nr:uncharacterized protein F5B22DRAFT_646922 [Xylaria bambusicola]KAI0515043.1 hypothetical protein F5B22DRAFT_646922 [Xylaria bambusicola]
MAGNPPAINPHLEPVGYIATNGSPLGFVEVVPDVGSQRPQIPNLGTACLRDRATCHGVDPSCLFRSGVVDDCARARWYARWLELVILGKINYLGCPFTDCGKQLAHFDAMLEHVKNCEKFATGVFCCSKYRQGESFNVRTGKECSWDDELYMMRKLPQKPWTSPQGSENDQSASRYSSTYWNPYQKELTQDSSQASTVHPPNHLTFSVHNSQRYEIDSSEHHSAFELPGVSSWTTSPQSDVSRSPATHAEMSFSPCSFDTPSTYDDNRHMAITQDGSQAYDRDLNRSILSKGGHDFNRMITTESQQTTISPAQLLVVQPFSEFATSSPALGTQTSNLESSSTMVSPERELQCDKCGWKPTGNKNQYLRKHKKTHEERTVIPCPEGNCYSEFTRPDNLKAHLKRIHKIDNPSPTKRHSSGPRGL